MVKVNIFFPPPPPLIVVKWRAQETANKLYIWKKPNMGQNIVMVYLAQLKIEWFFSQNIKWKKYNKKEGKWKIAKAEEHYAEKKPQHFF